MTRIINREILGYPVRVYLNDKEAKYCYEARVGSKGWVKCYKHPLQVKNIWDEPKEAPIKRGRVRFEPL